LRCACSDLPPNGTGALFAIVFIFYFIAAVLGLSGFIIVSSMMADVVEDAAVSDRPASEGLLFAANGLISKCVTGCRHFPFRTESSGWVSFPQHATRATWTRQFCITSAWVFVPIVTIFGAISIAVLMSTASTAPHIRELRRRRWWLESDSSAVLLRFLMCGAVDAVEQQDRDRNRAEYRDDRNERTMPR